MATNTSRGAFLGDRSDLASKGPEAEVLLGRRLWYRAKQQGWLRHNSSRSCRPLNLYEMGNCCRVFAIRGVTDSPHSARRNISILSLLLTTSSVTRCVAQVATCSICKYREGGEQDRTLTVCLATNGEADAYAIDRLIASFEVRTRSSCSCPRLRAVNSGTHICRSCEGKLDSVPIIIAVPCVGWV